MFALFYNIVSRSWQLVGESKGIAEAKPSPKLFPSQAKVSLLSTFRLFQKP